MGNVASTNVASIICARKLSLGVAKMVVFPVSVRSTP